MDTTTRPYDIIIVGAGAAGLSLAYYLSCAPGHALRIALVDPDPKDQNDRTWCFWGELPPPFGGLVSRSWPALAFVDEAGIRREALAPRSYHMVRGIDFYDFVKAQLRQDARITWIQAAVRGCTQTLDAVALQLDTGELTGRYVYNSTPHLVPARLELPAYRLCQHFVGWEIETEAAVFDPDTPWLMDFRTEQAGEVRFFYVLPYTTRRALVEYTIFSAQPLAAAAYDAALRAYIEAHFGGTAYRITHREQGQIPMSDAVFRPASGARIFQVGTPAGAVKPTTGYAFRRILRESRWLADQVLAGEPAPLPWRPYTRFSFYDQLLLYLLTRRGALGKRIFQRLFHHNPMGRILAFLDEETRLTQEVPIFGWLPILPFLGAVVANIPHLLRRRLARWRYRYWHGQTSPAPQVSLWRGDLHAPTEPAPAHLAQPVASPLGHRPDPLARGAARRH